MATTKERLRILDNQELYDLYGLPRFSFEDRCQYFTITDDEKVILSELKGLKSKVYFILQIGYFKARQMFFILRYDEIKEDIQHILSAYFLDENLLVDINVAKNTRLKQQARILELFGYQASNVAVRETLQQRANDVARISTKPIYVFKELLHFLESHRIVLPGYSYMQEIVSKALYQERKRLAALLREHISEDEKASLQALLSAEKFLHEITLLRKEPKDFSHKEIAAEIAKKQKLEPLYQFSKRFLPELDISNESIRYYATLVDFYTVYKLRRMEQTQAYVYMLCFIHNRYQRINDNLINCLISYTRKYIDTSKSAAHEQISTFRMEANKHLKDAGKVLELFTDDSIDDHLPFYQVKNRAFNILSREKFPMLSQYIGDISFDQNEMQWNQLAVLGPTFKKNLRPVFLNLEFCSQAQNDSLLQAMDFIREAIKKGRSLRQYKFTAIPKNFISKKIKSYIYDGKDNKKTIQPDKYEFLTYRLLRQRLEAGDIFCNDSIRFCSFEDDLINPEEMKQKQQLLDKLVIAPLQQPIETWLGELEQQLEERINSVNQHILDGKNSHFKTSGSRWSLPYTRQENTDNHPFFEPLPQVNVRDVLLFVNNKTNFISSFKHVVGQYVKGEADSHAISACLIAYGTNIGLGKMGDISDMGFQTLSTTANNYVRLETLKEANDTISNGIAKLPMFRHFDIDDDVHSSSDGQKFETQIHTINARYSSKYFGLNKGVTSYTLVANHIPVSARIIGANESESHYVFDMLFNNNTDIQPTIHSTDTHGTNEVNFILLHMFGYQFAPRYKDIRGRLTRGLYGFQHPGHYPEKYMLKPVRKINTQLIIDEWANIQRIIASLALKTTTQSVIVGKLSSYARTNRTKKALWELDNIIKSIYFLNYVDSLDLRQNVQKALNRGEAYHKLRRAVSYANFGKLRVKTELEQHIWNECSRLITNSVIYYNATILSELLELKEKSKDINAIDILKQVSPVAWQHINMYGRYEFNTKGNAVDLKEILETLKNSPYLSGLCENLEN